MFDDFRQSVGCDTQTKNKNGAFHIDNDNVIQCTLHDNDITSERKTHINGDAQGGGYG